MATTIEIENMITVGALADKLMLPVSRLIGELLKNGVMVTVNEQIDFDTAQIIVEELGLDVQLQKRAAAQKVAAPSRTKQATSSTAQSRPPVVAVMGHVDHGKTTLLDAIRGAHVAKTEAGGITQHISAYQIEHNGRKITFLDTPGHEAFSAIREHSAHLTDIAVIVVAADDGVKPQTIEAIRFARKANARIVVAINKIDKEGANAALVKQQLADQQLLVEEWGGDIVAVELSAKTGKGVPQLLDMILLVTDVEDLRAETVGAAAGLIIEAHVEQGRGPVAHGLVEAGILKKGDFIVAGATYAKIRNLESTDGKPLQSATPSTPVVITGFKHLPEFGDEFTVVANEKEARAIAEGRATERMHGTASKGVSSSELLRIMNRNREMTELNVVVKADAQGSLTSVIDSLKTLDTQEVAIRVVGSGIGHVTENDVYMAQTSNAIVYGFNIAMQSSVKQLAARQKVSVRLYNIIYELIEDAREELSSLLAPEVIETQLGRLIVRGVFNTTKSEVICGGEVTKGKLEVPSLAIVLRGDEKLGEVEVTNLKRGPADAKEVFEGEMCGLSFKTKRRIDLQEGDRIELFRRETVTRHL
ncbi:MAG TPA: translation initiation factor IF-2 [Candidatus Saccharimonadales bacterium]|nr:translation initiation factor IF-2 [Candidatus Saccharimonadales bacterium]